MAKLLRSCSELAAVWRDGILCTSKSYAGQEALVFVELRQLGSATTVINQSMQENEVSIQVQGEDVTYARDAFGAVVTMLDAVAVRFL